MRLPRWSARCFKDPPTVEEIPCNADAFDPLLAQLRVMEEGSDVFALSILAEKSSAESWLRSASRDMAGAC